MRYRSPKLAVLSVLALLGSSLATVGVGASAHADPPPCTASIGSVSVSPSGTLEPGETGTVIATSTQGYIEPPGGCDGPMTFTDDQGNVTTCADALTCGVGFIYWRGTHVFTVSYQGETATATVSVQAPSLKLTANKSYLAPGETTDLSWTTNMTCPPAEISLYSHIAGQAPDNEQNWSFGCGSDYAVSWRPVVVNFQARAKFNGAVEANSRTVTLTPDPYVVSVSQANGIETATSNMPVGVDGYGLSVVDDTTGTPVAWCSYGTQCTTNANPGDDYTGWVDLFPGWSSDPRHEDSNGNASQPSVLAGSGPPTSGSSSPAPSCSSNGCPWDGTVNLTADNDVTDPAAPSAVLTATPSKPVDQPYTLGIYKEGGALLTTCTHAVGAPPCSVTVTPPLDDIGQYVAKVLPASADESEAVQSNVETLTRAGASAATPEAHFDPSVSMAVSNWHFDGDDASITGGLINYTVGATLKNVGNGGPCLVDQCSLVLQGGMPDEQNILQPTATVQTLPLGTLAGDPDPQTLTFASNGDADLSDFAYIRVALYSGSTLLTESPWKVGSTFSIQHVAGFAPASLPVAFSVSQFLAATADAQEDPCLFIFPPGLGTHFSESSVSDEQALCEQLDHVQQQAQATADLQRIIIDVAKSFGTDMLVASAGLLSGYGLGTWVYHQVVTTLAAEDVDRQSEINQFASRERVYQKSSPATTLQYGPGTDPATLRVAAATVLQQCQIIAGGQSEDVNNCDVMPIFAPGNDVTAAAAHDWDAETTGPTLRPMQLQYGYSAENGWYKGWQDPSNPCLLKYAPSQNCDEYPFRSTTAGGPDSDPPASLRVINAEDNMREGRQLRMFYAKCGIKTGIPFLVVPTTIRSDTPGPLPTVAYCGVGAFAPGDSDGF